MSVTAPRPAAPPTARPAAAPPWRRSLGAVLGRGLRDQARAPLTWGGGLGALSALIAAMWPSIEGSVDQLLESYPEGLKDAFNIAELDSVEQYVDAEMLSLIVPLALAFFAIRCVVRTTVGAEERGHLDTLLSLPLSRRVLVAGSYLVTGLAAAAVLAVVWALTSVAGTIAGTGISAGTLAVGVFNVWPLAMAFAGLAVLAAGALRHPGAVTAVATGTLVAMYVVDVVGKLSDTLEPLRVASAFRWYGSAIQDGFDASHAAGLVLAGVLLAVAGAVLFERRDVR
jgi:ABC-2 type transport system permease protein